MRGLNVSLVGYRHLCQVVLSFWCIISCCCSVVNSFSLMRLLRPIPNTTTRFAARTSRTLPLHRGQQQPLATWQWETQRRIPTRAPTTSLYSSFSTVVTPSLTQEDGGEDNRHDGDDYDETLDLVDVGVKSPPLQHFAVEEESSTTTTTTTLNGASNNGHALNGSTAVQSSSNEKIEKDDDNLEKYLKEHNISSRPVPNGNWNIKNPLGWTREFGRRSKEQDDELEQRAHLKPGDEGYYDVSDLKVPGVTIVRTRDEAEKVLKTLQAAEPGVFHACDTEVMAIDVKSVGPVGNGFVTCVSMYSGPDFDYGLGDGPGTCLWIDNLDDSYELLQIFKPWFEDEKHWKVWHNYGFDRHVMWNHGIDVRGLGGDTMHMARLQDTSRSRSRTGTGNGYSLEVLTEELAQVRKKPMKEIFGVRRLRKDGTEGTLVDIPPVEVMQRDPKHRLSWIQYSSYDAKGTWLIREELAKRLEKKGWFANRNLLEYYMMHMRPFGEVLTDMERRGIRVDARDYLAKVEEQAREDREYHSRVFREWAAKQIGPDGWALNTASSVQLQTLLFGGSRNSKTEEFTEAERLFKVPTKEIPPEALEAYRLRDEEFSESKEQGE